MPIQKIEETLDCLPENAKAIPGCKWFYATPEGKIYRIPGEKTNDFNRWMTACEKL